MARKAIKATATEVETLPPPDETEWNAEHRLEQAKKKRDELVAQKGPLALAVGQGTESVEVLQKLTALIESADAVVSIAEAALTEARRTRLQRDAAAKRAADNLEAAGPICDGIVADCEALDKCLEEIAHIRGELVEKIRQVNKLNIVTTRSVFDQLFQGQNMMQRALTFFQLTDLFGVPRSRAAHAETLATGARQMLKIIGGARHDVRSLRAQRAGNSRRVEPTADARQRAVVT
jgi:hypothetical protein